MAFAMPSMNGQAGQAPGGQLAQMLAQQAPPQTPMSGDTPDIRRNPTHEWYEKMNSVAAACKAAMEKADEQEPIVKDFLNAVQQTCRKLITLNATPQPAIAAGLARAFDNYAPQIASQLDQFAAMALMQSSQPQTAPGGMGGGLPQPSGPLGNPLGGAMAPPGAMGAPTPQPGPGMGQL